mmetsp:Transcript_2791/g.3165  ORF Transcript_2791/g.3165 Transcript_2791/m.3165 type:complete len:96 (+) Transcript_2791:256-543(+)
MRKSFVLGNCSIRYSPENSPKIVCRFALGCAKFINAKVTSCIQPLAKILQSCGGSPNLEVSAETKCILSLERLEKWSTTEMCQIAYYKISSKLVV